VAFSAGIGDAAAMKQSLSSLFAAISLSLLAACGGGASAAAGVYELDKAAFKEAMLAAMPAEAKQSKEAMGMVDSMAGGMSATIELKADGTASFDMKMTMMGQAKEEKATGTWKLDGSNLTIVTKEKDGKEESKTATYSNGSFSIEENDGGQKMKMTFKRK
jgi:hypothetical protein